MQNMVSTLQSRFSGRKQPDSPFATPKNIHVAPKVKNYSSPSGKELMLESRTEKPVKEKRGELAASGI